MTCKTLPMWALEWGESVDALRALLRKRPDLAKLAKKFGAARVFDPVAARQIRSALVGRRVAAAK